MMYSNKLAIAIKVDGKVLREIDKDKVYLPFGKEFTILIKNLHTQRAVVQVSIDGNDAVKGGLVIEPNSECELERWVKDDLNEGNRFKFIERTGNIEKHRGVNIDDGLVRIEHQFEQTWAYRNYFTDLYTRTWPYDINNTTVCGSMNTVYTKSLRSFSASSEVPLSAPQNDAGITVPGSHSDQTFNKTTVGTLDPTKYSMVLHLLGETEDNEVIRQPVTVKTKPICVTCGLKNKASAKFCSECGTALKIYA